MKQILQNLRSGETEIADVPCPGAGAGKILIDLRALSVEAYGGTGESIATHSFTGFDRNQLFVDELGSFISAIKTQSAVPVNLSAGRQSLEMALAVRRSMETGRVVDMSAPA